LAFCYGAGAEAGPGGFCGVALFRSLADPKTLAFALLSVVATTLGCSRVPGEPEPLGTPWNADDIALGRCVQTCSPDYGPRSITLDECERVEEGLEFFPAPVWDWEDGGRGDAYSYQDGTTEFLSTNTPTCTVDVHAELGVETSCQSQYTPLAAPVDRCGSTRALHLRGGPFREWGGGLGVRLDNLANDAAVAMGSTCPSIPPETPDPATPAFCPEYIERIATAPGSVYVKPATDTSEEVVTTFPMNAGAYYLMQVDLREWEGISFWARRGPDSQAGIRMVLADLNMDDDASFLETQGGLEPTCRRAKECDCRNHRKCTLWPSGEAEGRQWIGGNYCAEPELDVSPFSSMHPWNHELYRCEESACDYRYAAYPNTPDAPFFTTERTADNYVGTASCNTHTFDNDITRKGCFDAVKGPVPPESADRCGDPWIAPVRLNGDWSFYKVPFSDFRQEGYGMEFPAIKLDAVTMVRFTWNVGWIDYWIDDVRFYRKK
jgi:hypothetical protein